LQLGPTYQNYECNQRVLEINGAGRQLFWCVASKESCPREQTICVNVVDSVIKSSVISSFIAKAGGTRLIPSLLGAETHTRSVLKAVSWRTLGTIDTFAISWFMTGRVEIAGSIAILEIGTKIAWYYLHERVWAAIGWGRRP
jgi:uncharacterized membrane protein